MRTTASAVLVIMYLCIVMFTATGCSHIMGGIINTAIGAAPNTQTPIFGKKENFIPKPGIDTKETIIKEFGEPDEIIIVDSNKEVLAYKSPGILADLYALKNGVYQDTYLTYNDEIEKFSKSELVQIFPCFREDVYAPRKYFALAQIANGMGRTPDDSFLLKDEQGKAVPNSTIVWYFNTAGNQLTRVLMISLRNNIATEVEEWTGPQAMSAYNSYVVLCQTMAARPPKFALR